SESLRKNKVHTEYIIKDKSRTTITKKRITATSNILFRIDAGTTSAVSQQCEKELMERMHELYQHIDAIIISDYECGVVTDALINAIKDFTALHHVPIVVD